MKHVELREESRVREPVLILRWWVHWRDGSNRHGDQIGSRHTSLVVLLVAPLRAQITNVTLDLFPVQGNVLDDGVSQLGRVLEDLCPLLDGSDVFSHRRAVRQYIRQL